LEKSRIDDEKSRVETRFLSPGSEDQKSPRWWQFSWGGRGRSRRLDGNATGEIS